MASKKKGGQIKRPRDHYHRWTHAETGILLKIYKKYLKMAAAKDILFVRGEFTLIAKEMNAKHNIKVTKMQVQNQIKVLRRKYAFYKKKFTGLDELKSKKEIIVRSFPYILIMDELWEIMEKMKLEAQERAKGDIGDILDNTPSRMETRQTRRSRSETITTSVKGDEDSTQRESTSVHNDVNPPEVGHPECLQLEQTPPEKEESINEEDCAPEMPGSSSLNLQDSWELEGQHYAVIYIPEENQDQELEKGNIEAIDEASIVVQPPTVDLQPNLMTLPIVDIVDLQTQREYTSLVNVNDAEDAPIQNQLVEGNIGIDADDIEIQTTADSPIQETSVETNISIDGESSLEENTPVVNPDDAEEVLIKNQLTEGNIGINADDIEIQTTAHSPIQKISVENNISIDGESSLEENTPVVNPDDAEEALIKNQLAEDEDNIGLSADDIDIQTAVDSIIQKLLFLANNIPVDGESSLEVPSDQQNEEHVEEDLFVEPKK